MNILAIETSFDETACAVVGDGTKIISNVLATSHEMHDKYGGVVPEIAARRQLECIIPVIREALEPLDRPAKRDSHETRTVIHASESSNDQAHAINETIKHHIDAIAVTVGPGLIGSLLVGVETAKTLAFVCRKPIIPVNHVLAHMYANFVNSPVIPGLTRNPSSIPNGSRLGGRDDKKEIEFPAISLVVSGGHTELYLMKSAKDLTWLGGTLDDAAGECFDKTARLLGFGHSGGVAIQEAAKKCHPGLDPGSNLKIDSGSLAGMTISNLSLPRPMMHDETLNFSFSGLKTAVMREWKKCHPGLDPGSSSKIDSGATAGITNAFAYEIQEAITDVLVEKTLRAARAHEAKSILLSGGVASNSRLREKFIIHHSTFSIHVPEARLCTDNAVMIGAAAYFNGNPTDWHTITAQPDLGVEV